MIVTLKNDVGVARQIKVGFSWTAFFFGGMPYFFRGMPSNGAVWILLSIVTFGISNLFLCFMMNKQTALYYLDRGYKPAGEGWDVAAMKWGVALNKQQS